MLLKREKLDDIYKWLPRDEIIILIGPRQSGKTALLKLIQKKLTDDNEKTVFLNLEDEEVLGYLNQTPVNLLKMVPPLDNKKDNKKIVVFLDEIQYLNNPTNFLKLLYDEYKEKIKLIVSGSSAFYIDKKFKDSLAGRKRIFYVLPLNFGDFLFFKGREEFQTLYGQPMVFDQPEKPELNPVKKRELTKLLEEYMIFGGYPGVVLEPDLTFKKELLEELLNSYVKKDAIEADIRAREKFFALLRLLASQVGALVNESELANTLAISTSAIRHYLYVMQKSFHIKLVSPFFNNVRKEISRMPKVFLFDLGLRNKVVNNFEAVDMRADRGELFENLVFKLLVDQYGLDSLKFWRSQSKNEVDFVLPGEKRAIEVKYNYSLFKTKKITAFRERYPDFTFHLLYHTCRAQSPKELDGVFPHTIF